MQDMIWTMAIWWTPIVILAILLVTTKKAVVSPVWLAVSIGIYAVYTGAIFSGIDLPGISGMFEDQQYNWSGKILAITASLVMIAAVVIPTQRLNLADAGLTLKQEKGSVIPSLIVMAGMIAFIVGLQLLANDGPNLDAETLIYQATIPGIDEELMFRGLLLLTLSLAVSGQAWKLKGATIPWGAVLATLFFALGHSIFVQNGAIQADWVTLVITGLLGGALMWIRLRTGSIMLPIIAHNATNLANQFF